MKLVFLAPWSVQILGKKYEVSSKAYYSLLGHISRESCESENLVWADKIEHTRPKQVLDPGSLAQFNGKLQQEGIVAHER